MPASRPIAPAAAATAALVLCLVPVINGCSLLKRKSAPEPPKVAVVPVKTGPKAPDIDYAAVRPNELGRIPVIMYHEIVLDNAPKKPPLSRTVSAFKKDLELLYAAGFRPVNMSDVVNDRIEVPVGKSPVVLTFDDARESQFRLIETEKALQIDPNCAMGILDAFHKAHEDWPMRAVFFVMPKSKVTMETFGQLGMGADKLQYIVSNGMEIGNHSTLHKSLRGMTPDQIQAELGNANNVILESVPQAKINVVALPMGQFPRDKKNWQYLRKGSYQGKPYEFQAVMDAAWRPIPSPASKEWDPARLERIDSVDGLNGIRDWITKLSKAGGMYQRYVSDGDPNVISFPKGSEQMIAMDRVKASGKLLNPYSPFGGTGGSKPIISADAGTPSVESASPTDAGVAKPIVGAAPAAEATPPATTGVATGPTATEVKPITAGG